MISADETAEDLEKLAAWYRLYATHAGAMWVWEARLRTAEDLERRAAELRSQRQRRASPRVRTAA